MDINVRDDLTKELNMRFQELPQFDGDSKEYGMAVGSIAKLYDRLLEEEKLDYEYERLRNNKEDPKKETWDRILDISKVAISGIGILTTFIVGMATIKETRRGRRELFMFETDGCITSKAGQMGYIPRPKS